MELHIPLDSGEELSAAIYRRIADAIADGTLPPGERLPATRTLAGQLGVARGTVQLAYERLLGEGLTSARTGAGTFVAGVAGRLPAGGSHPSNPDRRAARGRRTAGALRPTRAADELTADPDAAVSAMIGSPRIDFRLGLPDPALFPRDEWRRAIGDALRPGAGLLDGYAPPLGLPALRSALARHIALSRAVRAEEDDVIVTSGAQHGIALVARALLNPGDAVAVEDPGYPPIRALFRSLGLRVLPVPTDDDGLRVDALPPSARLVYTTPSHQFPLGAPLSAERRRQLLAWAAERGAAIIEDDYDCEFRYGGRPLDPLHAIDRAGRVIYVGTFSKSLSPALRLGFLVVPPGLRAALTALRHATDWSQDPVPQAALARLIDEGRFAAVLRRARREYERRHAALVEELSRIEALRVVPSHAGLHLAARLDPAHPRSARRIVAAAREDGIAVDALDDYAIARPDATGLALGFGRLPTAEIPDAVAALARHL